MPGRLSTGWARPLPSWPGKPRACCAAWLQECKHAFEEGREELEGLTDVDPQVKPSAGRSQLGLVHPAA